MNKMSGLFFALNFLAPFTAYCASVPFDNLKVIEVDRALVSENEPMDVRIYYVPDDTKIINQKHNNDNDDTYTEVLNTKLDGQENISVEFLPGYSADPSFNIKSKKSGKVLGRFSGLELFIPGNGSIYVMGHSNNCFNQRKKFNYKGNKFVEVKQPFYHVGLQTKVKKDVIVFADKNQKDSVASLPKGYDVQVLLTDNADNYLVVTTFGLTGWVKDACTNDLFDGVFFKGD